MNAVLKQKNICLFIAFFNECVCILAFIIPACKTYYFYTGLYCCVVCQALPYFPHYLIYGTIFRKKLLNIKCVF